MVNVKTTTMKNSDNKYYTPELEEFHFGFEYEQMCFNYTGYDEPPGKVWIKKEFGSFTPKPPSYYIDKKEWRVKHLDREDILDCGFQNVIKKEKFGYPTNHFKKGICYLTWLSDRIIIQLDDDNIKTTLFNGTIKNKSELKRLLKKLGVL